MCKLVSDRVQSCIYTGCRVHPECRQAGNLWYFLQVQTYHQLSEIWKVKMVPQQHRGRMRMPC